MFKIPSCLSRFCLSGVIPDVKEIGDRQFSKAASRWFLSITHVGPVNQPSNDSVVLWKRKQDVSPRTRGTFVTIVLVLISISITRGRLCSQSIDSVASLFLPCWYCSLASIRSDRTTIGYMIYLAFVHLTKCPRLMIVSMARWSASDPITFSLSDTGLFKRMILHRFTIIRTRLHSICPSHSNHAINNLRSTRLWYAIGLCTKRRGNIRFWIWNQTG